MHKERYSHRNHRENARHHHSSQTGYESPPEKYPQRLVFSRITGRIGCSSSFYFSFSSRLITDLDIERFVESHTLSFAAYLKFDFTFYSSNSRIGYFNFLSNDIFKFERPNVHTEYIVMFFFGFVLCCFSNQFDPFSGFFKSNSCSHRTTFGRIHRINMPSRF